MVKCQVREPSFEAKTAVMDFSNPAHMYGGSISNTCTWKYQTRHYRSGCTWKLALIPLPTAECLYRRACIARLCKAARIFHMLTLELEPRDCMTCFVFVSLKNSGAECICDWQDLRNSVADEVFGNLVKRLKNGTVILSAKTA